MTVLTHEIRRGISLYSYQEEYFLGQLTLEECIERAVSLGALGIETVAGQMVPGFPELPAGFEDTWHGWMKKYGFTATAHDAIPLLKLYKDRQRPVDELVAELRTDIDYAVRLGATIVRSHAATPPDVVASAAPYAADNGVRLLTEIHSPHRFGDDWFRAHMDVAARFGPDIVGLMPDFSIFARRFPRIIAERALRDGADASFVKHVTEVYDSGEDTGALVTEAEKRGLSLADRDLAATASRIVWEEPAQMLDYMPFIQHIQAKFWEMVDDDHEYSIPYDEVIAVLIRGGFRGYLSSEYEGNRHIQDAFPVDSHEQLRRQHAMMAHLLGETSLNNSQE